MIKTNAFVGQKFGTLTVVEILPSIKTFTGRELGNPCKYKIILKCLCRCGDYCERDKRALVEGNRMHCGKLDCKNKRMRSA